MEMGCSRNASPLFLRRPAVEAPKLLAVELGYVVNMNESVNYYSEPRVSVDVIYSFLFGMGTKFEMF